MAETGALCHSFTMLKQRLYMISDVSSGRRWFSGRAFLNWFGLPIELGGRPAVLLGLEPFGYVMLASNPASSGGAFARTAIQSEMERFFPPREPIFSESVDLLPTLAGKIHVEAVPARLAKRLKTAESFVAAARSFEDAELILYNLNRNPLYFGSCRMSSERELRNFANHIQGYFDAYMNETSLLLQILHRLTSMEPWLDRALEDYDAVEESDEVTAAAS